MMLVLHGSPNDLQSLSARKIYAAAALCKVPLQTSLEELTETPLWCNNGLVLTTDSDNKNKVQVGTLTAALSLIHDTFSAGADDHLSLTEKAQMDGWMEYIQTSIELPLEAQQTLNLQPLETLFKQQDFLITKGTITVADVRLGIALSSVNDTTTLSPAVAQYLQRLSTESWFNITEPVKVTPEAASTAATATTMSSVALNGAPTAVQTALYQRHRVRIKEALGMVGKDITVAGWARTVRKQSSKLIFVELNDGSTGTSLQCVLHECQGLEECKTSGGTGASFLFQGKLVASQGQGQAVEMQVNKATLLGAVFAGNIEGTQVGGMLYPMPKKDMTLEYMREQAHLRPRTAIHAAAMRIRHAMAYCTHHFFNSHGFLYIHTPIITGADCEGAGEQFGVTTLLGNDPHATDTTLPTHGPPKELSKSELKRLKKKKIDPTKPVAHVVENAVDYSDDFYGQRVNLTVSGQLNVETHACALSDVYTFGPTFRAENSNTSRHLSEFWMIEPEIAFADLQDDINLAEDYLKYCVQYALEHCAEDLQFFEESPFGEAGLRERLRNVIANPFKRITYTEAIELLQKAVKEGEEFEEEPVWGMDLPSQHERYICEKVYGQPVVLTDYPKEIKSFYMKLNDDEKTVAAADILVPKIGEIIGGSQREHRTDVLQRRCEEMNLDPRAVWWYLDLRRYGTVPHAGFGLGFERLILFITGLSNIRDVIPFPRWAGNAKF